MLRIKHSHLQAGMVTAEPVLDFSGKVLIEAGTKLTAQAIELLGTWDVSYVSIREEINNQAPFFDSDQAGMAGKIGLTEDGITAILSGDCLCSTPDGAAAYNQLTGSLVNKEGLVCYQKLLTVMTRLIDTQLREQAFSNKEFNELARIISDFILATPGVFAYALRPDPAGTPELARHLVGTAVIAGKLAMLLQYDRREMNNIVLAGLLHDIGKLSLPEAVWRAAELRTPGEMKLYRSHVQLGLQRIKGKHWIPREVQLALVQHHECVNGSGFPMGFRREKIHPYARVVAIADYVDEAGRNNNDIVGLVQVLPFLADRLDPDMCAVLRGYLTDFILNNTLELEDGRTAHIVYMHQAFAEPVIRTSDGEFIDLNKVQNVKIERYRL